MYWVHLEPGFPVPLQGYGPVRKRNRNGWRTMKRKATVTKENLASKLRSAIYCARISLETSEVL